MYQLALFGAATKQLIAATVDGDLESGVQFVGNPCDHVKDQADESMALLYPILTHPTLLQPCSSPIPGQSQGLIHDIPTVQELIDRCIAESIIANEMSMRKLQGQMQQTAHSSGSRSAVL